MLDHSECVLGSIFLDWLAAMTRIIGVQNVNRHPIKEKDKQTKSKTKEKGSIHQKEKCLRVRLTNVALK